MKSMYGGEPIKTTQVEKSASRVIGGLKAQNAHQQTFTIDGELVTFPKTQYVEQLEKQVKEFRNELREITNRQNKLIRSNNAMAQKIQYLEQELDKKLDK